MSQQPRLLVTTSPFLKDTADTAWIMWQVSASLIPVVLGAVYAFGVGVLFVIVASIAGAVLPEWWYARGRVDRNPLRDGSAVLTGLLLALTLPPGIPLWMAFVGGVVSIVLGKLVFGGIGFNPFNPALVGRAFLQAAFPAALTTWVPNGGFAEMAVVRGHPFALPFMQPGVDAVTTATPLSQMKFQGVAAAVPDLALGRIPGSIGETFALLVLVCGVYLIVRGIVNWRIPVAIMATVFLAGTAFHLMDAAHPSGLFHLTAGGLMLGTLYMATDPVSSPITQAGCWFFGVGIGLLVVVIRLFGGLPEGVMYAILFMNALTPVINRLTAPRTFGTRHHTSWTR